MIFRCSFCNFETDDEGIMVYCDSCNNIMCPDHATFIDHQGFDEAICKKCNPRAKKY